MKISSKCFLHAENVKVENNVSQTFHFLKHYVTSGSQMRYFPINLFTIKTKGSLQNLMDKAK